MGKNLKHDQDLSTLKEDTISTMHKMEGLQFQDEAIRVEQEQIKKRHLELQYMERDIEEI